MAFKLIIYSYIFIYIQVHASLTLSNSDSVMNLKCSQCSALAIVLYMHHCVLQDLTIKEDQNKVNTSLSDLVNQVGHPSADEPP